MTNKIKLLFFLFISSCNFNLIIKPLHLVVGGTNGIAIIINNILDISIPLMLLIINIIMFILSILLLDNKVTKGIVISTFVYPLFIKLTSNLTLSNININLIIVSAIISGITLGSIIKLGYSTGGVNVLIFIVKKYLKIDEYISNFIINVVIIILGIFVFGIYKALLSIMIIIINSIMIKIINVKVCKTKNHIT